jgi:nucleoid-associated protein YejK
MSAIREAILKRVQSRLFNYLKTQPIFNDYKSSDLWKLSVEITENNSNAIEKFLDEKKYTLSQTDQAIEAVLKEILAPEIGKLRI